MESRGSRHTLVIRRVEREDFANYSCYASNKLGRGKAYVTLRGKCTLIGCLGSRELILNVP